ncbi:hypothetical protein O3Q52_36240 [Streptomyces sp. ActVer]|uniref:hypothetical protein n=1 Tax=Streptomyces sp. ActVer TaxID=3014558 RepID=UPI0022B5B54D|nr:hypothetical protein [Streptomyces sp. ActVer]MCZ4513505.1 hypothetical protein [Streptomyces sp. ActVer]
MSISRRALSVDVWADGRTFTHASHRAAALDGSQQFRDAHRVETVDGRGAPWTVLWTRVSWEARVGPLSVLSVLCLPGTGPSRPSV